MAKIDDVVLGSQSPKAGVSEAESEGYETPYCDSGDEDSFEEIDSDGEVRKRRITIGGSIAVTMSQNLSWG